MLRNGKVDRRRLRGELSGDSVGDVRVFSIPMRVRFRGITVREGMLIRGDAGWGEWSPFLEYDSREALAWLRCAEEAAAGDWPEPVRDRVPVNVTVPVLSPEEAHELVARSGCRTAKVKVADPRPHARRRPGPARGGARRARSRRPHPGRRQRGVGRRHGDRVAEGPRPRGRWAGVRRAALRRRRGPGGRAAPYVHPGRGRRVDPARGRSLPGARARGGRHRGAQGAAARRGAGVPADRRGHRPPDGGLVGAGDLGRAGRGRRAGGGAARARLRLPAWPRSGCWPTTWPSTRSRPSTATCRCAGPR